ncbi:unknown [Cryptophlebia leucotreta granulovirus]|uniref:Chitin-binding type-2 domain-containing protein n=1 Tax=Cryptophlebia leucotreta granulosis virus TaxID=35254 RepID=Q7T5L9_GVCL|nr:hypothetical protein [Cryptophlebia leucotreta granulovirus]AAQ21665.1 unknown [Cryptophlebia leucotreta granulovirus]
MYVVIFSVFLFAIILVFLFTQSNKTTDGADLHTCTRADPSNCQQYYDCFGNLKSCSANNRYDEDRGICRDYYLTDCGIRYNPSLPSLPVLCRPFWEGLSLENIFPHSNCRLYNRCLDVPLTASILSCYTQDTAFSIEDKECRPTDTVDCGTRFI